MSLIENKISMDGDSVVLFAFKIETMEKKSGYMYLYLLSLYCFVCFAYLFWFGVLGVLYKE